MSGNESLIHFQKSGISNSSENNDEIPHDKYGFIHACEKGIIKTARQIFNSNAIFYSDINKIFQSSYGVTK